MSVHHFIPDRYYRAMGSYPPVLTIQDGDTVATRTVCGAGVDANHVRVTRGGNPVTGPFFVHGAERGDTLAVRLERIRPNRRFGYSATVVSPGVLVPEMARTLPESGGSSWEIDLERWAATLLAPETALGKLSLPLAPMLGCLGVAPDDQQAISTITAGPHGGNMDYRGYVEGVVALFPVFTDGALFFLGDGHAVQGDGEIVGSGIEVSMDVQFSVQIRKGMRIRRPRLETASTLMALGTARPLDQAVQEATTELVRWLRTEYRLDVRTSSILLGQAIRYEIGNIYNPSFTAVAKVDKQWLPQSRPAGERLEEA